MMMMRHEIHNLRRELRTTCIFVTHDQVEPMTLADRMIVMHAGIVEQIGRPIDVYDEPASLFVAGVIRSPAVDFPPRKRARDQVDTGGEGPAARPPGLSPPPPGGDLGGRRAGAPPPGA